MKLIKKLLNNTQGYTLVEVLLAITIFAIGIVPIYQIIVSGAKVQNVAEETYEATLHSQALLQDVKIQIEKDVGEAYELSRGLLPSTLGIKPWLNPAVAIDTLDPLLVNFLELAGSEFNEKYDTENYLYEVHIWPMAGGKPVADAISFTAPIFTTDNTSDFTKVEIKDVVERYFQDNDSLIWADLGGAPIAIGEIEYEAPESIKIKAKEINGDNITVSKIEAYEFSSAKIKLTHKLHDGGKTHELIVEANGSSEITGIVQLSIDLTTFPSGINSKVIRIENRTKATIVVPVYNEKNEADIKTYPIQQNKDGRIIVEERAKLEPIKNFVVGIIVRDANNIAFGEENKVLSKIVDVYSFDYNKQKRK